MLDAKPEVASQGGPPSDASRPAPALSGDASDPFEEAAWQAERKAQGTHKGGGGSGAFGPCCLLVALVAALGGALAALGGVPAAYVPRLPLSFQRAILDLLMASHVEQLSAAQPDGLKEAFFGGEPWLVHCSAGLLSPAFVKSPPYLANVTRFGLLDCEEPLPSGKSTRERFKLGASAAFTAANGNGPRPVPTAALGSAYSLAAYVRSAVALPIVEATSDEQLATGCSARPCLLLSERGVSGERARELSAQQRRLRVVTVPASHELRHPSGALVLALARLSDGADAPAEPDGGEGGQGVGQGGWLLRAYDGELSDARALAAFAAAIPAKAADDALGWFEAAEAPPKIVARRGRGAQRAGEASRRAQMAAEEAAYAKSLFAADDEGDDEGGAGEGEGAAEAEVERVDAEEPSTGD